MQNELPPDDDQNYRKKAAAVQRKIEQLQEYILDQEKIQELLSDQRTIILFVPMKKEIQTFLEMLGAHVSDHSPEIYSFVGQREIDVYF